MCFFFLTPRNQTHHRFALSKFAYRLLVNVCVSVTFWSSRVGLCYCHLLSSVRGDLWVIVHQTQSRFRAKACGRLAADPKQELTAVCVCVVNEVENISLKCLILFR